MTASLRLFGPERGAEAVHFPERHRSGFVIQLARLRQVYRLVLEVLNWEQCSGSLAGGRREDRSVHQREAVRIEVIADALDHLVTDTQNRMLAAAADPQVTMIHQKIDAVFLGRDGGRRGLRDALFYMR